MQVRISSVAISVQGRTEIGCYPLSGAYLDKLLIIVFKIMKAMKGKKCQNFRRCGRKAKSSRAKFCLPCFKENAAAKARSGTGNSQAKGVMGNAGNSRAKGVKDNAGNSRGNPDNAGNINRGRKKKSAGRRSGVKRCAKFALVVKKYWLDKILAREKDWEIRSCSTARRGLIHFAQSKAGGTLVGRARLVDCQELDKATFLQNIARHHVPRWSMVPYKRVFAWVLQDAQRYAQPLHYEHEKGAVIWAKTWGKDQNQ